MTRLVYLCVAAIALFALPFIFSDIASAARKAANTTDQFKRCCEEALGIYDIRDGKGYCKTRGDQQNDSFYRCVYDNSVRIKHLGNF